MNHIVVGATYICSTVTGDEHSAERYGNTGVDVVSTPALIGLLEMACVIYLRSCIGSDEGSVGIHVNVEHLAAAPIGAKVETSVRVTHVDGKRVDFDVEARWDEIVLMRGSHQRAIVNMERFIGGLPARLK